MLGTRDIGKTSNTSMSYHDRRKALSRRCVQTPYTKYVHTFLKKSKLSNSLYWNTLKSLWLQKMKINSIMYFDLSVICMSLNFKKTQHIHSTRQTSKVINMVRKDWTWSKDQEIQLAEKYSQNRYRKTMKKVAGYQNKVNQLYGITTKYGRKMPLKKKGGWME